MSVAWTAGGGHVIAVERDDRGVRLYDPQSNEVLRDDEIDREYSRRVRLKGPFAPRLLRVDDKEPRQEYVDGVLKRKPKTKKKSEDRT